MNEQDEREFTNLLITTLPNIAFLDDNVWPTAEPILRSSLSECTSPYGTAYIWNRDLFPTIPIGPRPGGGFQGPARHSVIQFIRSRLNGTVLRSGGVDLGFADPVPADVKKYFNSVWRILKKNATNELICVDPETRAIINPKGTDQWAWPGAIKWCLSDESHLFRDNGNNYFRPAQGIEYFRVHEIKVGAKGRGMPRNPRSDQTSSSSAGR